MTDPKPDHVSQPAQGYCAHPDHCGRHPRDKDCDDWVESGAPWHGGLELQYTNQPEVEGGTHPGQASRVSRVCRAFAEEIDNYLSIVRDPRLRACVAQLMQVRVRAFRPESTPPQRQWAIFERCGKNMGNDLLIIPCDLEKDHEGPCERNIWPVSESAQKGTSDVGVNKVSGGSDHNFISDESRDVPHGTVTAPLASPEGSVQQSADDWMATTHPELRGYWSSQTVVEYVASSNAALIAENLRLSLLVNAVECYWEDDSQFDTPENYAEESEMKVGDEFELQAAQYWPERWRVVKVPDETSDDWDCERITAKRKDFPEYMKMKAEKEAAESALSDSERSRKELGQQLYHLLFECDNQHQITAFGGLLERRMSEARAALSATEEPKS